eukprot:Gregarina_sp_Pseudo_9__1630@NODE_209_length_3610_cov_60_079530_g194_i0_p1_GENE_NODE_209_length_3610_cov_60_079530_g194_i0NODE_209_length_3610_cov_60_079530_g194_i0_p1_ORF_typecomplete_len376_score63_80JAB/PF01398_21/9_9e13Pet100/PF09803_9/0_84Pet100/PF09803_9/1_2e03_NODE_209_length_3610_cov_60_079530_g194_i011882315
MSSAFDRLAQKSAPSIKRAYPSSALRNAVAPAAAPAAASTTAKSAALNYPIGPTPNTTVVVDMQVMLRIATHCAENAPTVVYGELVGLEVSPGVLEISNCFVTPTRRDIWNPRERPDLKELEEKHRKEVEKFRAKVRELLHYVDADCQSVGWFQTMINSALNDPVVVEQLYQRMTEVDRTSTILCFDLERNNNGLFPLRAFHLSETYINLRRRQEAGDLSASNVVRTLSTSVIFTELKVEVKPVVAVDSLLLELRPNIGKRFEADSKIQDVTSDQLDRGLKFLSSALEEFTAEGERLMKYQKDSSRYHARRGMDRKRNEDHRRDMDDMEEEGREKRFEAPSHLKSLLVRGHVDSLATSVAQLAQENVAAGVLITK